MSETVTIVTAFFDIGRSNWEGSLNGQPLPHYLKRDTQTYLDRFKRLTELKNPIVVFTESKFIDTIKSFRDDIICVPSDNIFEDNKQLLERIAHIQRRPEFIAHLNQPTMPEYWSPHYVFINYAKSLFVNTAIKMGYVPTGTAAWLDFGYVREDTFCPAGMEWKFNTQNLINLFCFSNPDEAEPIFNIVKTNNVYVQGCHIVAPVDKWERMAKLMTNALMSYMSVDLIDDDQSMLLMSYRLSPHDFKINYVNPGYWFVIFRDFNHT
jgi:protein YibB